MTTEIPKINQRWVNRLPQPTDLPDIPWVQWRVENFEEVDRFLEDFEVRMRPAPGNQLLIQSAASKGSIQLSPGDCLVLWPASAEHPREQLGVVRAPESIVHREADGLKDNAVLEAAKLN